MYNREVHQRHRPHLHLPTLWSGLHSLRLLLWETESHSQSGRIDKNRSGPCHCLMEVSHLFELQGNFYGKRVCQSIKQLRSSLSCPNRILKSNKTIKVIN